MSGYLGWVLLGKYFYDNHMDPKSKYIVDDIARTNPITGPVFTAMDNAAKAEDYLNNTGLDWSDIKYHNIVLGFGSAGFSTLNFVSRNIDKLYGKK